MLGEVGVLIAKASGGGQGLLLLGLSRGNIERLTAGRPILLARETHGEGIPAGLKIGILYGETEQSIREHLERIGAAGPDTAVHATLPPETDDDLRRLARELNLGATGRYPHGRLDQTDQGELRAALTVTGGKIRIDFGKPCAWLALLPQQARELAALLLTRADELEGKSNG